LPADFGEYMINSRQRAYLRSLAMNYPVIFHVGKNGISEETVKQLINALEARELIKVRVLENCPYDAREAADTISLATESEVVCVTGRTFVLYRQSKENKVIDINGKL